MYFRGLFKSAWKGAVLKNSHENKDSEINLASAGSKDQHNTDTKIASLDILLICRIKNLQNIQLSNFTSSAAFVPIWNYLSFQNYL